LAAAKEVRAEARAKKEMEYRRFLFLQEILRGCIVFEFKRVGFGETLDERAGVMSSLVARR